MRKAPTIFVATAVTLLMLGARNLGAESAPKDVFEKVVAAYDALQTYKADGTITLDIESGGVKTNMATSFTILLKKPNLYLVTWNQKNTLVPGLAQSGAVWSDGTQPYLYLGALNAYSGMDSDEVALGGATGVSGGAAFTIPSLFLSVWHEPCDPFSRIVAPVLEQSEMVGDDDCYVISGASAISTKETYWISKASFLIRQYRRSLEPPEGGLQTPELSDEQIEKTLQSMGQEVTEARKKDLREMMASAAKMLKTIKMKGAATELHAVVSTPELSGADFTFVVPAGVTRKESLFGELVERGSELAGARATMDAHSLAMAGGELTTEEADDLEKQIEQNPDDVTARTKLLGYYFAQSDSAAARRKHVLWFIRNKPEHEILGFPYGGLAADTDQEAYAEGRKAWVGHLEREPGNLKLLEYSARYFLHCDPELARASLERARTLDGASPKWHRELGQLFALGMITKDGEVKADVAAKALEHYEAAYNLSDDMGKDVLLQDLARAALAANSLGKAKEYAETMLNRNNAGWNYGNNVHRGNVILGRIALRSGDLEEAGRRLLAAGNTPGSPQLDSFGPNMSLARELLQKGEKEIVLSYFELCSKFWKMGKERLDAWSAAVRDGNIPDFGPNLRY